MPDTATDVHGVIVYSLMRTKYSETNNNTSINIDNATIYQTTATPENILKNIQSMQSKDAHDTNITIIQGNPNMGTTIIYEPYQPPDYSGLRLSCIALIIVPIILYLIYKYT